MYNMCIIYIYTRNKKVSKINTNITLDPELKQQAIKLFKNLGLDLSSAISLFLNQAVREQRIPFEITMETTNVETTKEIKEVKETKKNKKNSKTNKKNISKNDSFKEIIKELETNVEDNKNKETNKKSKKSNKIEIIV